MSLQNDKGKLSVSIENLPYSGKYERRESKLLSPSLDSSPKTEELAEECKQNKSGNQQGEPNCKNKNVCKKSIEGGEAPIEEAGERVPKVRNVPEMPLKRKNEFTESFVELAQKFVRYKASGQWEFDCKVCLNFKANQIRSVIAHGLDIHEEDVPKKNVRFDDDLSNLE